MIRQLARRCFAPAATFGFILLATGGPAAALAPLPPGNGFYVDVALTARASALLKQRHASIVVSVWYTRDGANGAARLGDELIPASDEPVRVVATAASVAGQASTGINVGAGLNKLSDGASTQDAGLSCKNGMKVPLAEVQAQPVMLYCRAKDELAVAGHEPLLPPGVSGHWTSAETIVFAGAQQTSELHSSWTFAPDTPSVATGGGAAEDDVVPPSQHHHHNRGWPTAGARPPQPPREIAASPPPPPPSPPPQQSPHPAPPHRQYRGDPPSAETSPPRALPTGGGGGPTANLSAAAMPDFPWPPPLPSERMNLPHTALTVGLGTHPSLGAVGRRLVDALNGAGYVEYSFFRAPGGFALVARLEQFEEDGTPGPADLRFLDPKAATSFSLGSYVSHLFFAPDGYYRLIVFVVSDASFAPTHTAPSAAAAQAWLEGGANMLPPVFDTAPVTTNHQLTALIYEFHKHGSDAIATLDPGQLDARTHLMKSGLYARLLSGTAEHQ